MGVPQKAVAYIEIDFDRGDKPQAYQSLPSLGLAVSWAEVYDGVGLV